MNTKTLINKEDVEIGGKTFFISSIPAIPAQAIFLKAAGALKDGNIAAIPSDLLLELLTYAGTYNDAGTEVQFANEGLVSMFIEDPVVLMELEARMIQKNFGFLTDGRLQKIIALALPGVSSVESAS